MSNKILQFTDDSGFTVLVRPEAIKYVSHNSFTGNTLIGLDDGKIIIVTESVEQVSREVMASQEA